MGNVTEKQQTQKHNKVASSEYSKDAIEQQHEAMRHKLDEAERLHKERSSETDALHEAKSLAHEHTQEHTRTASPAERRRGPISKKQLEGSFESQMFQVRSHLSGSSRLFSKFIHSKPIEKTSDFVGATIARPNALLSGSIVAFISITLLYFTAKHFGYALTGFETIAAFIVGWVIGILYDYISSIVKRKHH